MATTAIEKAKEAASKNGALVSTENKIQLQIEASIGELKKALPEHLNAERMARLATTTLKRNPKLYQCDPMTFLGALFQAAQIGLELDVDGQCYIVPFFDNKQQKMLAQFILGYKGYITLFYRHQSSVSISLQTVHKNDLFSYDLAKGECTHVPPSLGRDRGEVIGYYAYATLVNGGHVLKVLSKQEALDWGKKFSKCWNREKNEFMYGTPWATAFDSMGMKTCMLQLSKVLPKSSELQRALSMDETVKSLPTAIKGTLDMADVPNEADYSLPDESKALPLSKDGKPEIPAQSTENVAKKSISALDLRIHNLKADLIKKFPEKSGSHTRGEIIYYDILGSMGAEHMTDLKTELDKETVRIKLQDALKAR